VLWFLKNHQIWRLNKIGESPVCDLGWILVHALLRKALETEMGKRN